MVSGSLGPLHLKFYSFASCGRFLLGVGGELHFFGTPRTPSQAHRSGHRSHYQFLLWLVPLARASTQRTQWHRHRDPQIDVLSRAGWVYLESIEDSQIRSVLIQHAGWEGGQHGWDGPIHWIFESGSSTLSARVARPAIRRRRNSACGAFARPAASSRPKKIPGPHPDWLVQRCRKADFTLRGLVAEFAECGLRDCQGVACRGNARV